LFVRRIKALHSAGTAQRRLSIAFLSEAKTEQKSEAANSLSVPGEPR